MYELDFKIKHVKGKEKKVENSRKSHLIALSTCKSDLRSRSLESQIKDETYLKVKGKSHQVEIDKSV